MEIATFIDIITRKNNCFFTGVPDSLLNPLCGFLCEQYGVASAQHIVAANEGNAVAIAAGAHLATGKTPVVYMQNSGLGNALNPIISMVSDRVYGVPTIFVVGWRGEPNVHDEPQHMFQGELTPILLNNVDIEYLVVDKKTTSESLEKAAQSFDAILAKGKSVAYLICKNALTTNKKYTMQNSSSLVREEVIASILEAAGADPVLATTGKSSREVFELRERCAQLHRQDFLTVGSMGHCSSIALGAAMQRPEKRFWCIDGDGAALMHMGAIPVIAACDPQNFVHIVLNNCSHESVGGIPTAPQTISFVRLAEACGYDYCALVEDAQSLRAVLQEVQKSHCLSFVEVKIRIGSRKDLGRPTNTVHEMKQAFAAYMQEEKER